MTLKNIASSLVLLCATFICAPVFAQPTKPAAPLKQTTQAKELLSKASEAAKKLKSLNYSATVSTEGIAAPKYAGTVGAQRTEAGPWAILVSGTITPPDGKSRDLRVAYDGVTGRSVNEADQTVTESNVSTDDDVRLFFMSQEAGAFLPWELLASEPLATIKDAGLEIVGRGNVDGADCKILQVTPAAQGATPAEIVRYFIPATDFLPRKIERVSQGAAKTTQTLQLAELKTDERLASTQFVLSIPDGYTVKAANKKPPKPPKPARPVQQQQRREEGLARGTVAPNWKLKNAAGVEKSLADYKGKVVVMDFWGTWCPPCVSSLPKIQKVHEKFAGKPVAVLGMNFEQSAKADPAALMKKKGCTYELILHAEKILGDYQVNAFPTLIVVGMDGKVTFVEIGAGPELEANLTAAIEDALIQ